MCEFLKYLIIMNNSIIYSYQGSDISFISGDSVMVNATQMARSFKKTPKDWLRTKQTQYFIATLSAVRQICLTDLVKVLRGGNCEQGTWMHEDVALEFARWLSPAFAVWCNDCIKELLRMGVVTLERQNTSLLNEIKAQAPKVKYVDDVLQSVSTYTSTQIAKELGMREAKELHKLLKERKIMFKQSRQWMLMAKYCGKGYTKSRTTIYTRSDDSQITKTITVWTELGRAFLHQVFTKEMQTA